jgi:beta-N-acetylhexosaminidase
MGQAYIQGVHEGSEGRVATVAKHFPGHGGSDRRADEEVSTVPKSLQELRKIELAPFFTVTALGEADPAAITEALMSSHIRYRGFQGNIRQLTPPISFAAELQAILSLPEFEPWRQAGGIMVTDALGVPAVRKYYDPQLQSFPHKRVAQEAFLAGNDLLVLSQFALTDVWADQFENIKSTIEFFRDKYVSDSKFQAQVDQSLARILRLKHELYPEFSLEETQVDVGQLAGNVGQGYDQVSQIAEDAAQPSSPWRKDPDSHRRPPGSRLLRLSAFLLHQTGCFGGGDPPTLWARGQRADRTCSNKELGFQSIERVPESHRAGSFD